MKGSINGNIVLPDRIFRNGSVEFEDGIITAVKEGSGKSDVWILPGFVDIHNHGAMGHDYMECTKEAFQAIGEHLARHGVTSAQCTTVSAPVSQLKDFIAFFRNNIRNSQPENAARFLGIHLEGPFISPESRGAHPLEVMRRPTDGYGWILKNRDVVHEVTLAPDLPGMPAMIRDLTDAGIVVSGGHDRSEPADIDAAAESGMTHCTHIYCAMSTLHKTNAQRYYGLCEYAMTHGNITAEMIADGHHIPSVLAQMIWKCKGADGACVVSDAISPAGLPESEELYSLGTGEGCTKVFVQDGVALVEDRSCYAGSVQALDQMVHNLVYDSGIPLTDAVKMASLTPARIIGADREIGSIRAGKRADFCIMDSDLQVMQTVIGGKTVWEK